MKVENILIKKVGELRSGTSETTGKKWASRNILLAFEDETGESYISAAVEEDVWKALGHEEGQTVSVNLKFRTKRFSSGVIANDIKIIHAGVALNDK